MRALSREEVRSVDRRAVDEFGMSGVVLMENAGRGCAELLLGQQITGRVAICCGRGNNGGDGFVIARHLDIAGIDVRVLLLAEAEKVSGDAAVNLQILRQSGIPVREFSVTSGCGELAAELSSCEWVVDSLLGTGTSGEIREPYRSAIGAINDSGARVLAVDLPSGLDCDSGEPLGPCVRAVWTATFVAEKLGFANPASRAFTGEVHVIGIGVPRRLLTYFDA
jgi:NAD(P)H-hydrate epimerase